MRKDRSLRWRTLRALQETGDSSLSMRAYQRIRTSFSSVAKRPWILPIGAVLLVASLQAINLRRAPLEVFFHDLQLRELLTALWQVEATTIALVVAASLFAFESLTRQRSNIPLAEYANRSHLLHFLMLGSAGLLAIPVVLFATLGLPAPTASFAAVAISLSGLASLPGFFMRAMKVTHPSWLRKERLADIREAATALVRHEAFELVGFHELSKWARGCQIVVSQVPSGNHLHVAETAKARGVVVDIDLDRLESFAREVGPQKVVVSTWLNEHIREGKALVRCNSSNPPSYPTSVVTVSKGESNAGKLQTFVDELHEEAMESIRRASPLAAAQVADLYSEAWLAWPRAWASYGRQLEGGLISGFNPLRIRPTDEMKRNVSTTVQMAVDEGLSDHVHAFLGILWKVAFEALELPAEDLVTEMTTLSRWQLTTKSARYPELADGATETAWRFQIELSRYVAHSLTRNDHDLNSLEQVAQRIEKCFASLVESLKTLLDHNKHEAFGQLDRNFGELLRYQRPTGSRVRAQALMSDPDHHGADEDTIKEAATTLERHSINKRLDGIRNAGRLSLVAWLVRKDRWRDAAQEESRLVRTLANSVGTVDDLVAAMDISRKKPGEGLSRWLMFDQVDSVIGTIDTDGPLLTAFAISLLGRPSVERIPPSPWITERLVDRFTEIVDALTESTQLWTRIGENTEDVTGRAEKIKTAFAEAHRTEREIEILELASQQLDTGKVERYKALVVEGWQHNRLLPRFTERFAVPARTIDAADWQGDFFGFAPSLDPKGLFVTPTNSVGLDNLAREEGATLARSEASEIIKLANAAEEIRAGGDARQRMSALLQDLRTRGYAANLIVLPFNWRLARALGLAPHSGQPSQDLLETNVIGTFEDVTVIEWWGVSLRHAYAIDAAKFCQVEEGVSETNDPMPPKVSVKYIDAAEAERIVASWESLDDQEAAEKRTLEVRTKVRIDILRMFRCKVIDGEAARSVAMPLEESDNPTLTKSI